MNRRDHADVQLSRPPGGILQGNSSRDRILPWRAIAGGCSDAGRSTRLGRPPPGFTLSDDADLAFTSPDGATGLEQYMKSVAAKGLAHWKCR
ncbi:hypothetical protein ACVWYQ_004420 [Bradyrhizobium sp. USDA 3397]